MSRGQSSDRPEPVVRPPVEWLSTSCCIWLMVVAAAVVLLSAAGLVERWLSR